MVELALTLINASRSIVKEAYVLDLKQANSVILMKIATHSYSARDLRPGHLRTNALNLEHLMSSAKRLSNVQSLITAGLHQLWTKGKMSGNACHCIHKITSLNSDGTLITLLQRLKTILKTESTANQVSPFLTRQMLIKQSAQQPTTSSLTAKKSLSRTCVTRMTTQRCAICFSIQLFTQVVTLDSLSFKHLANAL